MLQMRNKVSNTRDKVEIVKYKITLYRKSHCVIKWQLRKIKFQFTTLICNWRKIF